MSDTNEGRYIFADFGSGRIFALANTGDGRLVVETLVDTPYDISSLGEGVDGEIYFTDYTVTQRIHKMTAGNLNGRDTVPERLEDTGCVDSADPRGVAQGLIPYQVNASFWSDSAEKIRHFAIPDGTAIEVDGSTQKWLMPPGSVVMKSFSLAGKLVETRLLMRHPDGIWGGYTYEWNSEGTSASRIKGGKAKMVDGQPWIFPREGECMRCHTSAAGFSIGLEEAQLNLDMRYPGVTASDNQLSTLRRIGVLAGLPIGAPATSPRLSDPSNSAESLESRARAYLHANCAQCHRPSGPTPSALDLRYSTPLGDMMACDVVPSAGNLGLPNARLIALGDASRSVLVNRMSRRDSQGMPPVATGLVDIAGASLLTAWVNSLSSCD